MNLELETLRIMPERSNKMAPVVVRELTEDDFKLFEKAPAPKPESAVRRLSERHKNVARFLTDGYKPGEVAVLTGYSEGTIKHLMTDPAFQNLLQFFANHKEEAFVPYFEKLAEVGAMALDLIRDKLEEEPEKQTMGQLQELVKMTADRTGFGPQTTSNVNVQVNIADRLQAARKRIEASKVIEGTATETAA